MNEERLEELERRLAEVEGRLVQSDQREQRMIERMLVRILDSELKIEHLLNALKEYDMVRAAAYGGYFATHPEVRQDLASLEDILRTAPPPGPTKPPSEP